MDGTNFLMKYSVEPEVSGHSVETISKETVGFERTAINEEYNHAVLEDGCRSSDGEEEFDWVEVVAITCEDPTTDESNGISLRPQSKIKKLRNLIKEWKVNEDVQLAKSVEGNLFNATIETINQDGTLVIRFKDAELMMTSHNSGEPSEMPPPSQESLENKLPKDDHLDYQAETVDLGPSSLPIRRALFNHLVSGNSGVTNKTVCSVEKNRVTFANEGNAESDDALEMPKYQAGVTVNGILLLERNRLSYCAFCGEPQRDLSRHLKDEHANSVQVMQWTKTKKKRTKESLLRKIQNMGNYRHNCKVIQAGTGKLIVGQPISEDSNPSDFAPCPECLGFFSRRWLLEHNCLSNLRNDLNSRMTRMSDSKLIFPLSNEIADSARSFVVQSAQEIEGIIAKDELLCELGYREFARFEFIEEKCVQTKSKISNLSKFLAHLNETNGVNDKLQSFIDPGRSHQLLAGLKTFCIPSGIPNENEEALIKMLFYLRECGVVLRGKALEEGNWLLHEKSLTFVGLCDWWMQERVNEGGNQSSLTRALTADIVRVFTEDVVMLWRHLCEVCTTQRKLLEDADSAISSAELRQCIFTFSKAVLTKVFMFNKEEEDCIAKMRLKDFQNRLPPQKTEVEDGKPLNWREHLLNSLTRVSVKDETGHTKAVLLTEDMVECIDLLISKREAAHIYSGNEEVFTLALFSFTGDSITASDCTKEVSRSCGLIFQGLVTTPMLNKALAIAFQLTSLSREKFEVIKNYLGDLGKEHEECGTCTLNQETLRIFSLMKPFLEEGILVSPVTDSGGLVSSSENMQDSKVNDETRDTCDESDNPFDDDDDCPLLRMKPTQEVGEQVIDSEVNDETPDTCDESDNPCDDDDCPLFRMKPTQEVEGQAIDSKVNDETHGTCDEGVKPFDDFDCHLQKKPIQEVGEQVIDPKVNDETQDTCDESDNPFDGDDCPLLRMKPTHEVEGQAIDSEGNDETLDTCDESDNPCDDDDCPLFRMKPTQEVEGHTIDSKVNETQDTCDESDNPIDDDDCPLLRKKPSQEVEEQAIESEINDSDGDSDESYIPSGYASVISENSLKEQLEDKNQDSEENRSKICPDSNGETCDTPDEGYPQRRLDCLKELKSVCHAEMEESSTSDSEPDEEDILRDKDNDALYVRRVITSFTTKTGKKKKSDRVYNSRFSCPFCHQLFANFSQHLLGKKHEDEEEVIKITRIQISKDDDPTTRAEKQKERKKLLAMLRNKGAHQHNQRILEKKKGEILLARRDTEEYFSVLEYGPCPNCLEWLKLTVISRHQSTCLAKDKSRAHITKGNLLMQSAVISGRVSAKASDIMLKEVFPSMQCDEIGLVAQKDPLVVALGNQWLLRNVGNKLMRKYYASAVMRLSSRLLIELRSMVTPSTGTDMEDYLSPPYFEYVAKAALKVACQDSIDEENLQTPSNAIKLSYYIKRLSSIKLANAIQASDPVKREAADDFLKLVTIQWSTKLERVLLEERKHVQKVPLPLPLDVKKLSEYLKKEALSCDLKNSSYENFRKVVTLGLASLITYNRRRPGEVQAMTLSAYRSRKTGADDVTGELIADLSKFEKIILLEQDVIEIRVKCGKFVPVLVPQYIKDVLHYITDRNIRNSAGISSANPYVFANNKSGVIRGVYAIEVVTSAADLSEPSRIRCTNMRRFMATMSQGLNVTPQQQRWIIDQMGHSMNVHNIHCRSTLDTLERVDITKLLLMMDTGQISQHKNKTLQDIQLEDLLKNYPADPGMVYTEQVTEENFVPEVFHENESAQSVEDTSQSVTNSASSPQSKKKKKVLKRKLSESSPSHLNEEQDDSVNNKGKKSQTDSSQRVKKKAKTQKVCEPKKPSVFQTTNIDGVRLWDKKYYCLFCGVPTFKIPRHLQNNHASMPLVMEWLAEKDSTKRLALLAKIRNMGNCKHNCQVLKEGVGRLIVVRRPSASKDPGEFIPCPDCYGFFTKSTLWKHGCLLPVNVKGQDESRNRAVHDGKLLLPVPSASSQSVLTWLAFMKKNEIVECFVKDWLICEFAQKDLAGKSLSSAQLCATKGKLKTLASLLLKLQASSGNKKAELLEFLDPSRFPEVEDAIKALTGYDAATSIYSEPHTAQKMWRYIRMCSVLIRGTFLEIGEFARLEAAYLFGKLCDAKCLEATRQCPQRSCKTCETQEKESKGLSDLALEANMNFDQLDGPGQEFDVDELNRLMEGEEGNGLVGNDYEEQNQAALQDGNDLGEELRREIPLVKPAKRQQHSKKHFYSEEEKEAVWRHLGNAIRFSRLPGKKEIMKCKSLEPVLVKRTWKNIKDFCRNTSKAREKSKLKDQAKSGVANRENQDIDPDQDDSGGTKEGTETLDSQEAEGKDTVQTGGEIGNGKDSEEVGEMEERQQTDGEIQNKKHSEEVEKMEKKSGMERESEDVSDLEAILNNVSDLNEKMTAEGESGNIHDFEGILNNEHISDLNGKKTVEGESENISDFVETSRDEPVSDLNEKNTMEVESENISDFEETSKDECVSDLNEKKTVEGESENINDFEETSRDGLVSDLDENNTVEVESENINDLVETWKYEHVSDSPEEGDSDRITETRMEEEIDENRKHGLRKLKIRIKKSDGIMKVQYDDGDGEYNNGRKADEEQSDDDNEDDDKTVEVESENINNLVETWKDEHVSDSLGAGASAGDSDRITESRMEEIEEENRKDGLRKSRVRIKKSTGSMKVQYDDGDGEYNNGRKADEEQCGDDNEDDDDDNVREEEDADDDWEPGDSTRTFAVNNGASSDEEYTPRRASSRKGGKPKACPTRRRCQKRPWSQEEKEAVYRHLEQFIVSNSLPSKNDITKCKSQEAVLKRRTWRNIKDFCRNAAVSKQRKEAKQSPSVADNSPQITEMKVPKKRGKATPEEQEAVRKHFKLILRCGFLPTREVIEKIMWKEALFDGRSWRQIREFCIQEKNKLQSDRSKGILS